MNKNTVKITESDLRKMILESIHDALVNEDMDEGLWNQFKTGAKTFAQKGAGDTSLRGRWDSAKRNFQTQGKIDSMDNLKADMLKVKETLQQMLDNGILTPNTTVEQILSNQTKFNSFSGKRANLQGQMYRQGLSKPTE